MADSTLPWLFRHWWAALMASFLLGASAVNVIREPQLLGVIKATLSLILGLTAVALLLAGLSRLRDDRREHRAAGPDLDGRP